MMDKKIFWNSALVGGTIIGLCAVAFSIVLHLLGGSSAESSFAVKAVNFFSVFVEIFLIFVFTRRFAAMHSPEQGFSLGRAVGFVVAMMLFSGFIGGIYSSVMANFFIKDELLMTVQQTMAQMQDLYTAEQFDSIYGIMQKAVVNPIYLTISSILGDCFTGLFTGLIVGFFSRRRPDIFATPGGDFSQQQ